MIIISLSGVLVPGPLTTVTIAKGYENKLAGCLTSFGHGVVEFPLMALIYLGLAQFFNSEEVKTVIGLIGGLALVYMGIGIIKIKREIFEESKDLAYGSITAGVIATGSNPYFFLWWGTIGAALIVNASIFGPIIFITFMIVHWLCDFLWLSFVSIAIFKSRRFLDKKLREAIFSICGLLLIAFGLWFILSAFS